MTKKDYELVAREIRFLNAQAPGKQGNSTLEILAENLGEQFALENPRFDFHRFVAACKGEDYKSSNGRTSHYSKGVSDAR